MSKNDPSSGLSKVLPSPKTAIPASPDQQSPLIAYVHNLSPLKRNKKNTLDYSTLTLQSTDNTVSALCYSKKKRKILEEKVKARIPVKVMRYTTSTDKSKIVINDKTLLSAPEDVEYDFQYTIDEQPLTPLFKKYLLMKNPQRPTSQFAPK